MIPLEDGWKHPLAKDNVSWEIACEFVAEVVGRKPMPPAFVADRRARVLKYKTGCTEEDIKSARFDDAIYLALVARYVPTFDELLDP